MASVRRTGHRCLFGKNNEKAQRYRYISILAPEIVLLYKSRNIENISYQHDYEMVVDTLDKERYDWFMNAMKTTYPNGHKWIRQSGHPG